MCEGKLPTTTAIVGSKQTSHLSVWAHYSVQDKPSQELSNRCESSHIARCIPGIWRVVSCEHQVFVLHEQVCLKDAWMTWAITVQKLEATVQLYSIWPMSDFSCSNYVHNLNTFYNRCRHPLDYITRPLRSHFPKQKFTITLTLSSTTSRFTLSPSKPTTIPLLPSLQHYPRPDIILSSRYHAHFFNMASQNNMSFSPLMIITDKPQGPIKSGSNIKITAKLAVGDPTGNYMAHADALDASGKEVSGVLKGQLAASWEPMDGGNPTETIVFRFDRMKICVPGSYQIRIQAYEQVATGINQLTITIIFVEVTA